MMHGPCVMLNPTNVCMKIGGGCKDNYQKHFIARKIVENDSFS